MADDLDIPPRPLDAIDPMASGTTFRDLADALACEDRIVAAAHEQARSFPPHHRADFVGIVQRLHAATSLRRGAA